MKALSVGFVALGFLSGGYLIWNNLAVDACLDRGGMWAGRMGCRTELPHIDRIVIDKSDRKLFAFQRGRLVETMDIALGRQPTGDKYIEGDNRTPEGLYPVIAHKNDSAYHRALWLGYPTPSQLHRAKAELRDPGGEIMIHGLPNGFGWLGRLHLIRDWTRGCVAVTNGEVDWLYQSVPNGTPVRIQA